MTEVLTELAKNRSLSAGEGRHDVKLRQRARGGDGGTTQTGEVIAVSVSDAFDQTEGTQAMQLARQARVTELGHEWMEIGAAYPVEVELGTLQRAQQSLLGAGEEVQPLDCALASLRPSRLACMHGSAWRGDGAALLRTLGASLAQS